MKWTPRMKYRLSEWSEKEYGLPFRYTSAAKNIFLSSEYKQSQYPELSFLFPGFEALYDRWIDQNEKLETVLRYIENCILDLEKSDTCEDKLLCDWWIGLVDNATLTDCIETFIKNVPISGQTLNCTCKNTVHRPPKSRSGQTSYSMYPSNFLT